ncbi:NADP oxidoreductase coenzyme F420-dependent [Bordetella bronchiseptica 99-R-0433]|uniref:NAD(P)-dependent oxidoreductase n=1 Tax=Bordetella bronchiseptica TaxID=518 RepID=UPI000459603B|nr:NAD(P)-dependent oxidoreductase [Bordetella bronchiseptica]KCV65905.1 NADP oxidoreductase coenzyme F420-dependent [Bordetella bronchiseptica 99-R-0433]
MSDAALSRIGFIGLGAMGGPICGHLAAAGHDVAAYDIRPTAVDAAVARGARPAASLREAASDAQLLVLMVHNAAQADAVLFGQGGAAAALPAGAVVWLASTVAPAYARGLQASLRERGFGMVDGPVSGGATGAQAGTLTIMVSGDAPSLRVAEPAMRACSSVIHQVGEEAGAASTVKLVNQLLTASHIALTAEALALGARAGVDPDVLVQVISQSAGASLQFEKRAPRMAAGDHAPQSTVDIFLKDLEIALDAARALRFPVPIAASAHQVFSMAAGAGDGPNSDTTVLRVYERNGGVDVAAARKEA